MQKKERESNIEFLRIVLMLMIIFWHCNVHFCNNINFEHSVKPITSALFMSLSVIGVNCFISISGLFGINFKIKTLVSFWIQALFYSILIYIVSRFMFDGKYFQHEPLVSYITPIIHGKWWFLSTYIAFYIIVPFIDKGLSILPKRQYQILIVCLIVFEVLPSFFSQISFGGDGTNLYSFITLYIIVRYLTVFNIKIKHPFLLYGCTSLLTFLLVITLLYYGYNNKAWSLFNYSSLLVIIGAISFLYLFKKIKIRNNKLINSLAATTFGVYLIHDSTSIRLFLKDHLQPIFTTVSNPLILSFYLLITTCLIFLVCSVIERLRLTICTPFVNFISKKIESLINK